MPQIVNFALVPVYTRYLAPTDMGVLEIVVSTQAFWVYVMRLGLPGALARLHFDYDEVGQRDLTTTIHHAMMGIGLVVTALWVTIGPPIFRTLSAFHEVPFYPYMTVAMAGALLQIAPELQRRLLQVREESALSAKLSASQGILTTALNVILVIALQMGALGVLVATTSATAVFWAIAVVRQRRDLTGKFRLEFLKHALAYGSPLVPHHLAVWAQSYLGRWILASATTVAAVGQLSLAARVSSPLGILVGAFGNAYSPVYFSWRSRLGPEAALHEAKKVATAAVGFGGLAVLGAATCGGFVVRQLMSPGYFAAAPLVGIVASALYLQLIYTVATVEIFFSKRTRWISTIFICAAAVNAACAWVLSSSWGAIGAAVAQVAGGIVSVVLVQLYARVSFPPSIPGRPLLAFGVTCGGTCIAEIYLNLRISPVLDGVCSVVAFIVVSAIALVGSGSTRVLAGQISALLARRRGAAAASS